jgi:gliding motility-associated-like protein
MPTGAGDYSAVYTIGTECLKIDYTLTIPNAPMADFTFSNACPGVAVPFTDASTIPSGAITGWDWDFGDGGTSTLQNPTHSFAASGTYTVTLTVTSDVGCTNTLTQDITIHPVPVADIATSDVCFNETSMFADASTGATITGWSWDFGDGGTSLSSSPTNLYAATGAYNVILTVTSDMGCTDAVTEVHNVTPQPVANFLFTNACEGNAATFDDVSTVIGGAITGWSWDFGDGGTSTASDPTHVYATAGTYNVELIANAGSAVCADTIVQTITAYPTPVAGFAAANVCLYDPAVFTDGSTITAPEVIATWAWDFGDATTSAATSPSHNYVSAGTYNVTLTVTSGNGCIDAVVVPVTIYPVPTADFNHSTVCENQPPTLFNDNSSISSGSIIGWNWDFGDGATGSGGSDAHNYSGPGSYNVQLTVTSNNGCLDNVTIPVTVNEKPTANFTSDQTIICNPGCITFTDLSSSPTAGIASQLWTAGTGSTYSGAGPIVCYEHNFSTPQTYDVTLIVTNALGCADTISVADYITVVPTPIAGFGFQPHVITIENTEVVFNNSSVMAESYSWNFGDGSPFTTEEDPSHTYAEIPKEYTVELEAYSFGGACKDSATALIIIDDVIIFYVPNIFTPDGDSYNEFFLPVFYSGFDPYNFHMTLFNRWGEVVFESYNAAEGWNGTYGDRGLVEDGTYIWQIEFLETMSDKKHKHRGHVTILK